MRTHVEVARWVMLVLLFVMPLEYAIAAGATASVNTPPPYPEEINIIAQIPEFGNSNNLRLNGTTVPNAVIDAYVNSQLFASTLADETGNFVFRRVLLDRNIINNVTLIATRDDGLTGGVSGLVTVDDVNPLVDFSSFFTTVAQEQGILLQGNTSEPATVIVELNDESEGGFREVAKIESNVDFSQRISLNEGNTEYRVSVLDRAKNDVIFSGFTFVDTTPPRILEDNLAQISPTYSRSVTIRGKVSEEATVRIVLNGKDSGYQCSDGIDNDQDGPADYPNDPGCNSPTDNSEINPNFNYACSDGLDNDDDGLRDFPKDLGCDSPTDDSENNYQGPDTECSDGFDNDQDGFIDFNPASNGDWGCSSLSDNNEGDDPEIGKIYTTKTDSNGIFSKDITLPISFGSTLLAPTSNSVYNTKDNENTRFEVTGSTTAINTEIELFAIDSVGLSDTRSGQISYSSCSGGDGGFAVFQNSVFPTSILPDHLFQGIAQVSFEIELSPIQAQNIESIDVDVSERRLSAEDKDVWDVDVFNARSCDETATSDRLRWYITCQLDRYPPNAYQNISGAYDALEEKGKVSLPLNLVIRYSVSEETVGQPLRQYSKTQLVCYDMEFPLDVRLDPDDIPRDLLNSTVEIIDDTLEVIDEILPVLAQVKWIVFASCLGFMLWMYINTIGETSSCIGVTPKGKDLITSTIWGSEGLTLKDDTRDKLIKVFIDKGKNSQLVFPFAQDSIESTINGCIVNKESAVRNQQLMQGFCDRIFCPAIPSAQKYAFDAKQEDGITSACSTDFNDFFTGQNGLSNPDLEIAQTTMCENEYQNMWRSACPLIDPLEESRNLQKEKNDLASQTSRTVNSFFNGLSICEFGRDKADSERLAFKRGGSTFLRTSVDGVDRIQLAEETNTIELDSNNRKIGDKEDLFEPVKISGLSPSSTSPYLTSVDGCVVAQPEDIFYNGRDAKLYTLETGRGSEAKQDAIFLTKRDGVLQDKRGLTYTEESKGKVTMNPYTVIQRVADGQTYTYIAKEYDPSRDENPECFRSDAVSEYGISENIKDPTGSFISAIQCWCLPAVEGYLINIRNILLAIKNCFESILVTGEFDAGVCKAILTQYLCDFVYDLLGCIVREVSYEDSFAGERNPLGEFFSDLRSGGEQIKDATSKRYGNAQSFKTLFNERQVLRSVCLAAFGYDWQPDLEAAISSTGGGISINSTGIIAPATRRFNGYNAVNEGITNNVYHIGYFLTAGEPLVWSLELICSTTNDCDPNNFEDGKCDCANSQYSGGQGAISTPNNQPFGIGSFYVGAGNSFSDPTIGFVRQIDGGQLQGGQSVGSGGNSPYGQVAGGRGSGDLYEVIADSPVRFDKVRLCWTPTSNEGKPGCIGPVPIRQVGGNYPAFCSFSLALGGKFSCGYFNQEGAAYLDRINEFGINRDDSTAPGTKAYDPNDKIQYEVFYTLLGENEYGIVQPINELKKKFLRMYILDEEGTLLYQWKTDTPDTLEISNGRIVMPDSTALTPNQLVNRNADVVVATNTVAFTMDSLNTGGKRIRVNSIEGNMQATAEGEGYVVIKYANGNVMHSGVILKNTILSSSGDETSRIDSYIENNMGVISNSAKEFASTNGETFYELALPQRSNGETASQVLVQIDTSGCSNGECYAYYHLKPRGTSQAISQRCSDNEGKPLKWRTIFRIVDGDGYGNPTTATSGTPTGQTAEKTIDLLISCGEAQSTLDLTSICAYDVPLTESCLCRSSNDSSTSVFYDYSDSNPKICNRNGELNDLILV